ncbi:MAG: M20 aminoacylase family protein [Myxococcota bacterium]|nr:M20 aminoacylase family protein [Myxococcota bacterium]
MPVIESIIARAAQHQRWRRQLHQHPELAFHEHETARFVEGQLRSLGLEVVTGLAQTGVVGTLRRGEGPAIGLRADLDALPIQEHGQHAHRSRIEGKMHACGHDGHVTMLLAAAEELVQSDRFQGTVHFIFQPAEENEAGGRVMVEEGLFERFPVEGVYGLHNLPGLPFGEIALRAGAQMASADFFEATLVGVGGHAAWPHSCVDPIPCAAQLVLAWQQLVSRRIDPLESAVLSVTRIEAGESPNAIPSQAVLSGTVRALSEEIRTQIETEMEATLAGLAAASRLKYEWRYERRYPVTMNDPAHVEYSARAAAMTVGEAKVSRTRPPLMGSEDFGWMLRAQPGCYILLGAGEGRSMLHHPAYDFNDELTAVGASYWVHLVESLLGDKASVSGL